MNDALTQEIWSALPLPALIADADGMICQINPAAELFLNTTVKKLRLCPVWQALQVHAGLEQAISQICAHGASYAIHDTKVSPWHIEHSILCHLHLAPIQHEGCTHVLMLLHPEGGSNFMLERTPPYAAAKTAIGMGALLAHEIKNPLAGITGAAQLLADDVDPQKVALTGLIVAECKRIVALLEDVEQFGDLRPPAQEPVNIHDVLMRVHKSAEVGFAKHMQFIQDFDPSLPDTIGDIDQLTQAFMNLVKNAAEVQPQSGVITLKTYYDHTIKLTLNSNENLALPLQIEIIDNGPGIADAIAENIFEPFVSSRENGRGLGLALVSKIVTLHQGRLSCESAPGRTVFRLSLPVYHKKRRA